MTQYAGRLEDRFRRVVADILSRLRRLESRTAAIDSGMPLHLLPAQIDPAYTSGDPKVLINGSATLSGPYGHLTSYTPAASDHVLIGPIPLTAQGGSVTNWVVLGKVTP